MGIKSKLDISQLLLLLAKFSVSKSAVFSIMWQGLNTRLEVEPFTYLVTLFYCQLQFVIHEFQQTLKRFS